MNVIARLEYELAYYDSTLHRLNHYTTRTPAAQKDERTRCLKCHMTNSHVIIGSSIHISQNWRQLCFVTPTPTTVLPICKYPTFIKIQFSILLINCQYSLWRNILQSKHIISYCSILIDSVYMYLPISPHRQNATQGHCF